MMNREYKGPILHEGEGREKKERNKRGAFFFLASRKKKVPLASEKWPDSIGGGKRGVVSYFDTGGQEDSRP